MMTDPFYERMAYPRPEDMPADGLAIEDFYPIERLQALQDAFADAHNLAMIVVDMDGKQITRPSHFTGLCQVLQEAEKVRERCQLTYKVIGDTLQETGQPAYQECLNCAFVEAGIPILAGGRQVATFLVGQNNALGVTRQRVEEFAWSMQVDVLRARKAFAAMPSVPVEQFNRLLFVFSNILAETVDSAYRVYLLEHELKRQRQIEKELRQKGINLVHNSAKLRQVLNTISRDLQEMLHLTDEHTTGRDELKPNVTDQQAGLLFSRLLSRIRRTYRVLLDAMAIEQVERSEMEKEVFKDHSARHISRFY